jgi:hypothetical protein
LQEASLQQPTTKSDLVTYQKISVPQAQRARFNQQRQVDPAFLRYREVKDACTDLVKLSRGQRNGQEPLGRDSLLDNWVPARCGQALHLPERSWQSPLDSKIAPSAQPIWNQNSYNAACLSRSCLLDKIAKISTEVSKVLTQAGA